MKTKELIKMLESLDPLGELQVTLNGLLISSIITDEINYLPVMTDDFNKVKKVVYQDRQKVINIKHSSVLDLFLFEDNLEVDYSNLPSNLAEIISELHQKRKDWIKNIDAKIKLHEFYIWINNKCVALGMDNYNFLKNSIIFDFFKDNTIDEQEIPEKYGSGTESYKKYWDDNIEVNLENGFLNIKLKNNINNYSI